MTNTSSPLGGYFDDDSDEESIGPLSLKYGLGQSSKAAVKSNAASSLGFFGNKSNNSPVDNQLGSTFLADQSQKYSPAVDQSVNLMDSTTEFYGPDTRPSQQTTKSTTRTSILEKLFGERVSIVELPLDHSKHQQEWNRLKNDRESALFVLVKLLIVATVVSVLAVVNQPPQTATKATNNTITTLVPTAPTAVPTTNTPQSVTQLEAWILDANLTSLDDLQTPNSSAHRAFLWVQEQMQYPQEDNAVATDGMKDSQTILQLYAIAVFYYATHPDIDASTSTTTTVAGVSSGTEEEQDGNHLRRRAQDEEQGTEWMNDINWCDWKGIQCNPQAKITHIKLQNHGLKGTIPSELQALTELVVLDLGHNDGLSGTIPPELGNLTGLTYLDLKKCNLTGTLPESIGQWTQLHAINLEFNYMHGAIPKSLQGMTDLQYVILSNNCFQEFIPPFTGCHQLLMVDLDDNDLSGTIPFDSLSLLENLEEFRAGNNLLSGTVSSEIETWKSIKSLSLKNNHLSGQLSFLPGDSLVDLDLSMNNFEGPLPPSLGALSNLKNLELHNNDFTGLIPSSWFDLMELESIILNHNKLNSPIPADLGQMKGLKDLRLNHNGMIGTIPDKLGTLQRLQHLHLESNHLTGTLPPSFADMVGTLEAIELFNNNITGDASAICSQDTSRLQVFTMDCSDQISCECCTRCY